MIETEETLVPPPQSHGDILSQDRTLTDSSSSTLPEDFEFVIQPSIGWLAVDWKEMFDYRELLAFFIWRDISARYKQTILGGAWAILQPLIMVAIFSFVASFAKVKTPMGLPYPVFVFAGLIPWTMFAQGMPAAANSLIGSLNMVTKVYFPRLFLPITAASIFVIDGVLALGVYSLFLLYYGIAPQWTVVFLPLLFLLTLIASLSIGVLLSGLTLFYRDFKHIVPFLVQIMMYISPIFYPISMVPEKYHWFLSLNPMFGILDAFRSAILGTPMQWQCFLISSTVAVGLFIFGVYYFRRTERLFADYV